MQRIIDTRQPRKQAESIQNLLFFLSAETVRPIEDASEWSNRPCHLIVRSAQRGFARRKSRLLGPTQSFLGRSVPERLRILQTIARLLNVHAAQPFGDSRCKSTFTPSNARCDLEGSGVSKTG
jgi:hypothetical protein